MPLSSLTYEISDDDDDDEEEALLTSQPPVSDKLADGTQPFRSGSLRNLDEQVQDPELDAELPTHSPILPQDMGS
ncbi:hypothetical protein Sjap_021492 [Stephania japonica]|uniref:Uncharacterized protein n=1 Tax=Stephania japonica TaxID=461633 RepID=A0AAP0EM28_9MAGN